MSSGIQKNATREDIGRGINKENLIRFYTKDTQALNHNYAKESIVISNKFGKRPICEL
jgi:hypothetical protein